MATADAVMNNLRGDQPEKLRLDYASLKQINPKIVCLHISAYGRDNARKAWPGYDFLMQAEAGLMSLTGEPDGPPAAGRRLDGRLHDRHRPARSACSPASCARRRPAGLRRRRLACSTSPCTSSATRRSGTSTSGDARAASRAARISSVAPVQTFPTADGWIFVMCMTDKFWEQPHRRDRPAGPRDAIRALPRRPLRRPTAMRSLRCSTPNCASARRRDWLQRSAGLLPVGRCYEMDAGA